MNELEENRIIVTDICEYLKHYDLNVYVADWFQPKDYWLERIGLPREGEGHKPNRRRFCLIDFGVNVREPDVGITIIGNDIVLVSRVAIHKISICDPRYKFLIYDALMNVTW